MSGNKQGVLTQPNVGTKGTVSSQDELSSVKKGTTADQHDMERLGKTQETKVRRYASFFNDRCSDRAAAQLSLHNHSCVHDGPHVDLGSSIQRFRVRYQQRRKSRRDLDVPWNLRMLPDRHRIHGRDV